MPYGLILRTNSRVGTSPQLILSPMSMGLGGNGSLVYGSTAYQCINSGLESTPKRYRYTGKEKDEETNLYHYGVCYYIPWLGRWIKYYPPD